MSSMPGTARSIAISRSRSGRMVGSPPVIRRRRKPSGASCLTIWVISSYVRMSALGSHGSPSRGMQ
jgi:hypothetical protein